MRLDDQTIVNRTRASQHLRQQLMGAFAAAGLSAHHRQAITEHWSLEAAINSATVRARIDRDPDGEHAIVDIGSRPATRLLFDREQIDNAPHWVLSEIERAVAESHPPNGQPETLTPTPARPRTTNQPDQTPDIMAATADSTQQAPTRPANPTEPEATATPRPEPGSTADPDSDRRDEAINEILDDLAQRPDSAQAPTPEAIRAAYQAYSQAFRGTHRRPQPPTPPEGTDDSTDPSDLSDLDEAMRHAARHENAYRRSPQWQRIKALHTTTRALIEMIKDAVGDTRAAGARIRERIGGLVAVAVQAISDAAFTLARQLGRNYRSARQAMRNLHHKASDHYHRLMGHLAPGRTLETDADIAQGVQDLHHRAARAGNGQDPQPQHLRWQTAPADGRSTNPSMPGEAAHPRAAQTAESHPGHHLKATIARGNAEVRRILNMARQRTPEITHSPEWQRITRMRDYAHQVGSTITPKLGSDAHGMAEAIWTRAFETISNASWELMGGLEFASRRGAPDWHTVRLLHHAANETLDDLHGFAKPDNPPIGFYDGITDAALNHQTNHFMPTTRPGAAAGPDHATSSAARDNNEPGSDPSPPDEQTTAAANRQSHSPKTQHPPGAKPRRPESSQRRSNGSAQPAARRSSNPAKLAQQDFLAGPPTAKSPRSSPESDSDRAAPDPHRSAPLRRHARIRPR